LIVSVDLEGALGRGRGIVLYIKVWVVLEFSSVVGFKRAGEAIKVLKYL
jgi:hypothetical protein